MGYNKGTKNNTTPNNKGENNMRNYYMNETEGKIYTENEMDKIIANNSEKKFDGWRLIGQFKSRNAAWAYYRDNM